MAAPQRENSLEGTIHRGNLSGWNSVYKRHNSMVVTIGMCAWCDSQKLQRPEDSIKQELHMSRANSAVSGKGQRL